MAEKTSFSVVWKGKTTLQIDDIIPKLSDVAYSLEDFEDSSFEHLIIVHPPADAAPTADSPGIQELTQFQVQFDQGQIQAQQETVKDQENSAEPRKAEEAVSSLTLTTLVDNDSMINGSTGSCTSSMLPQCGSEASDIPDVILSKRDSEIDDIISKDHIQMSRRDLNQLFDSFECDSQSTTSPIISLGDETEKIFRFSAYDRLQPNLKTKTPSETSSDDIVDIPITSNMVPEYQSQIERALSQHENFDISQDEISSASIPSDLTPEHVTDDCFNPENAGSRSLLFEYENPENVATHPGAHPTEVEIDDEWLTKDDNPMAKLSLSDPITDGLAPNAANVEMFTNSGDIRERGLDHSRTNDEIRAEMNKSRNLNQSTASRAPHGPPSNNTEKGFNRDRTTKRSDDWDSSSSTMSEGRTRDFRERPGYDSNRNHNRRSEGGLGSRDSFNRSSYSGKMGDNWNQDRRDNRQNNRNSWGNSYSDGNSRNGGYSSGNNHSYNMGTPGNYRNAGRRNSYNSDGGNDGFRQNQRNNHRNNFSEEKHGRSGSTQHQGNWSNNNDSYCRSPENRRMGPTSPRSNNRMDGTPTMNRKMAAINRHFLSDHCNRDDFNGQTKQLHDESFAVGGMRSDNTRNVSYIPPHNDQW